MNLDELQTMQNQVAFLKESARPLEDAFERELPIIESAIKQRISLRLKTTTFPGPRFSLRPAYSGHLGSEPCGLNIGRCACLVVFVLDTPVHVSVETLKMSVTPDSANQWQVWLQDLGPDDSGPSARTRKDSLALLLHIGRQRTSLEYTLPPRYLWWQSPRDNEKVVAAVVEALAEVGGPSEFSFHEFREAPNYNAYIKIFFWLIGIIIPPILIWELWGHVGKEVGEFLSVTYWVFLSGTIGCKIGRHKRFSAFGLIFSILLCVCVPLWGIIMVAFAPE